MTIYEATVEAHRRLGHSEAQIKDATRFASLTVPGVKHGTEIKPGKEEEVICALVEMGRFIDRMKKSDLEAIARRLARVNNN